MSNSEISLWEPNNAVYIPRQASSAGEIANFAQQLRRADIDRIVAAFDADLCELAVEYVWKRTMSILKRQLAAMGMGFVGEMLARPDIDNEANAELVLTDYDAIELAHQLGIVNRIGALELRQAAELLSYYASPDADEYDELSLVQAVNLLRSCVVHILAREKIDAALDFAEFRNKLSQQVLLDDDPTLATLCGSQYFFKRTTIRVLLADVKANQGAQLENALANLDSVLRRIWVELQDPDKWQIGQAYAEANANNRKLLSATLQRILTSLHGFDYVPETLRSSTYTKAANDVLAAHIEFNNFYNEPIPMKILASLGSTIPGPAFQICMRATLAVKLGNAYGNSAAAQKYADKLLNLVSQDRWSAYLSRSITSDELVLSKLTDHKPATRWINLVEEFGLADVDVKDARIARLLKASASKDITQVQSQALAALKRLGP
ncbi:MAG: hypothetical protein NT018_04310 [Armatimonadetes bacterium]|nr:hypothetical protein [Armatimonadota bacterium]